MSNTIKLKRGQKLCKNCNTINGVRSYNCKSCNHPFVMSKKNSRFPKFSKRIVTDITSLEKGDKIKVLQGSGTYHIDSDGNKHYLGNPGIYTVDFIDGDTIMAINKWGTLEFIYMGPEKESTIMDNLMRAPHKVIVISKAGN